MTIIQYISDKFKQWNSEGINVPLANDGHGKPSITLLFTYISFIAVLLSIIYIHVFPDKLSPTSMTITTWVISLVLYKMRMIDKMKFSAKDQSFELDAEDSTEETKPNSKDDNNDK